MKTSMRPSCSLKFWFLRKYFAAREIYSSGYLSGSLREENIDNPVASGHAGDMVPYIG